VRVRDLHHAAQHGLGGDAAAATAAAVRHHHHRALQQRAQQPREVRRRRLLAARDELAAAAEFDYVVTNEDLEATVDAVEAILAAESHRASRIPGLSGEIRRLRGEVRDLLHADAARS
jgi:hypothetical protein